MGSFYCFFPLLLVLQLAQCLYRVEWRWTMVEETVWEWESGNTAHAITPVWHSEWDTNVGDVNTVVVKIYECITFKLHINKCECRAEYAACVQHIFICTKRTYFHLRGFYDTRFFHSFHALAHANMFYALKFNKMMLDEENERESARRVDGCSGWYTQYVQSNVML